jgi:hypothetical protein
MREARKRLSLTGISCSRAGFLPDAIARLMMDRRTTRPVAATCFRMGLFSATAAVSWNLDVANPGGIFRTTTVSNFITVVHRLNCIFRPFSIANHGI